MSRRRPSATHTSSPDSTWSPLSHGPNPSGASCTAGRRRRSPGPRDHPTSAPTTPRCELTAVSYLRFERTPTCHRCGPARRACARSVRRSVLVPCARDRQLRATGRAARRRLTPTGLRPSGSISDPTGAASIPVWPRQPLRRPSTRFRLHSQPNGLAPTRSLRRP